MDEALLPASVAYAAILTLGFVVLSVRTLLLRRRLGVGVGTGDDMALTRAIRAHGHFAEYVPLALLLMYFLEMHAGAELMVHFYGVVLIAGRVLHAYGVSQVEEDYRFRVAGMACTFIVLIGCAMRLLAAAFGV